MEKLYAVYSRESLEREKGEYKYPCVNAGVFKTPKGAKKFARQLQTEGKYATVGDYYRIKKEDFENMPYKQKSIYNPERWTLMLPGSVLIYEGLHFEIV